MLIVKLCLLGVLSSLWALAAAAEGVAAPVAPPDKSDRTDRTDKSDKSELDPKHQVKLEVGDLTVVVSDHAPRPNYEGLHLLSHREWPENIIAPLAAGMIGVRGPCRLEVLGKDGARLISGEGKAQVIETFQLTAPHYIDYSAVLATGRTKWGNTSYMNELTDSGIYLRKSDGTWARHLSPKHGHAASVAPEGMNPLPAPEGSPDPNKKFPHGTDTFRDGFSDLRFDPKFPVFYGRIEKMVLIFMIERRLGAQWIPYMSPSGGGGVNRPAWDYRFLFTKENVKAEQTILVRLCYKPWVDEADVVKEYEGWVKLLEPTAAKETK